MNIAEIYDSSMLSGAIVVLNNSKEKVSYKCQEGIAKARQNVEEAEVELANSQRLLSEAIIEEARCLQEVHFREAELAAALSSNPINPAYVAYCQNMLYKAQVEYEKAVAHRQLMERRVALVQNAVSIAHNMLNTLILRFNYSQEALAQCISIGCNRLQSAHFDAERYANRTLINKSGPSSPQGKKYDPNSYVTVDGNKYRTDDNGNAYAKLNPKTGKYTGLPNTKYTLNGYSYETDKLGRITSASGRLRERDHEGRATINDKLKGMRKYDEKGHLIGDQFGGSNLSGNLVPMDFDLNRKDYKNLEMKLSEYVNKYHKAVNYNVAVKYIGLSNRPSGFEVKYTVDGEMFKETFKN